MSDTKSKVSVCRFTITGEFIEGHVRGLVEEGNWQRAITILKDDLVGITYDQVVSILDGSCRLIGDSNVGVDIVPEDRDISNYLHQIKWLYSGVYQKAGRYEYWQVYARVDNWGPHDIAYCRSQQMEDVMEARAKHYRESKQDEALALFGNRSKPYAGRAVPQCYLFQMISPAPIWMKFPFSPDDAITNLEKENIRTIKHTGHQQVYGSDYAINYNVFNNDSDTRTNAQIKEAKKREESEEFRKNRVEQQLEEVSADRKKREEEEEQQEREYRCWKALCGTYKESIRKVCDALGEEGYIDLKVGKKVHKVPNPLQDLQPLNDR